MRFPGSWHDKQSCPLEPSRTRNWPTTTSVASTWALWQVVHSMLPFTRWTAPVVSAVFPCATSEAIKYEESFRGRTKLTGCEFERFVPKVSEDFIEPVMGNRP